ncbi:MAG: hypothetical protein HY067_19940 [Betaproteobacteria bacterium]|nr:hypothetical protein [Betaproteobacteria bacterium]
MRIVTTIVLLTLSGFAVLADAAKEPMDLQENNPSITDKRGSDVSAKKEASVVRTHSGSSSRYPSNVMGRR